MNTALKRTLLSTLVVPFALGVQSASAAMIDTWDYQVDSNFSGAQFTTGNGTQETTDNSISWGGVGPTNRSSVSITDADSLTDVPARPKLETNGDAVNAGVFSHNNSDINLSFATLSSFDLTSTLTLIPLSPEGVGSTETLPSITYSTFFTETPNNPGAGTCAFGAPPCGDIFNLGNVDELGSVEGNVFRITPQSFVMDGYTYTVFLELAGLDVLPNDVCSAAGVANGCVGLLTPEGGVKTFQSSFRITAEKVPEPGTLALLGLGLAGLGLSRRKKAAKA